MAGNTTTSISLISSYSSQVGMSPQNLFTPWVGAALSARSVPLARFSRRNTDLEPMTALMSSSMTVVSVLMSSPPRRQASICPIDLPWLDSPPRNRIDRSR